MGVRSGGRALVPPWILKFSVNKGFVLVLSGKSKFHHFCPPPWKNFGKITECSPLEIILPTPMVAPP